MRSIKVGQLVKHIIDGYGIGIVLIEPTDAGRQGDGQVVEVLNQSGEVVKWFTDLVRSTQCNR